MKKHFLTLILILAVLIAGGFLPGPNSTVQATGADETALLEPVNPAQADSTAFSANPALQIVVGLTAVLFGLLAFLPQLLKADNECDTAQPASPDE